MDRRSRKAAVAFSLRRGCFLGPRLLRRIRGGGMILHLLVSFLRLSLRSNDLPVTCVANYFTLVKDEVPTDISFRDVPSHGLPVV